MAESSVKCKINIFGAKNIVTKKQGSLFIRCYLTVGKNKRVQLNTSELMSSAKDCESVFWDENFSLECSGGAHGLKDEKIVFELRWRNANTSFLGQKSNSRLLASAEVAWKSVFDEPNFEVQNWVSMARSGTECCDTKPPALQVGLKVEKPRKVSTEETRRRRRQQRLRNWDDCCCANKAGFCSCADNELFLVAAVLDVC